MSTRDPNQYSPYEFGMHITDDELITRKEARQIAREYAQRECHVLAGEIKAWTWKCVALGGFVVYMAMHKGSFGWWFWGL